MIKLNFWQKLLLYCIYIHLSSFLFSATFSAKFSFTKENSSRRRGFPLALNIFFCCCLRFRVRNLFDVGENKVFSLSFRQHTWEISIVSPCVARLPAGVLGDAFFIFQNKKCGNKWTEENFYFEVLLLILWQIWEIIYFQWLK